MKTPVPAILLGLASVLSGCGGGGGDPTFDVAGGPCSDTAKKQFVLDTARDRYLFLDLLPASVDISQYATAGVLVDALAATARAQNKDRFFSYITTITAEQQLLAGGTSVGFGVSLSQRAAATRLFVAQVFEVSAAADAGFLRGDEILAIGSSDTTLENVSAILARTNGLTDALGPGTAGIARTFRILTAAGATVLRTVTKREFSINPVPQALVRVIDRSSSGNTPVGYLFFRSYISPADDALRNAFLNFRNQGVRDVIIDLRYNGGGLVATAEILMNLLGGDVANQVMYRTRLNRNYTASQQTVRFATPALTQAIRPLKIAFITTESSASASELTINTLAPYVQVAIVGSKTFGKPVGQTAHDIASCDFRLRLISFGDENRDGYGDYFAGLPPGDANYTDDFCPLVDDLSKPLGAANENLYAEALGWINQNRCGTAILSAPQQKASADVLANNGSAPVPLHPEPFQVYMPGSF